MENQPQPVIAGVAGEALGAGCLLVLACDLAVAADDARLGIPATRLGVVVSFEMIERLVAAAGPKRASDLLESGHEISGETAAEWGLVNRAVPAGRPARRRRRAGPPRGLPRAAGRAGLEARYPGRRRAPSASTGSPTATASPTST